MMGLQTPKEGRGGINEWNECLEERVMMMERRVMHANRQRLVTSTTPQEESTPLKILRKSKNGPGILYEVIMSLSTVLRREARRR